MEEFNALEKILVFGVGGLAILGTGYFTFGIIKSYLNIHNFEKQIEEEFTREAEKKYWDSFLAV